MKSDLPIQHHALEALSDSESLLVEDKLWWVRGRKFIIKEYLETAKRNGSHSTIMDIGCGSGGNFDVLRSFGRVIGVEPSETLARRARSRGIADVVFQGNLQELNGFDDVGLVTMFDVLEHIENDGAFLAELHKKISQKHHLLVSVPACELLYSDHDRMLHHYRRYAKEKLQSALEQGGYQVVHMSHFMFFLFPLAVLTRMKDKVLGKYREKKPALDIGDVPSLLSLLLESTLRIEALLSRLLTFPMGLWLFALAASREKDQADTSSQCR